MGRIVGQHPARSLHRALAQRAPASCDSRTFAFRSGSAPLSNSPGGVFERGRTSHGVPLVSVLLISLVGCGPTRTTRPSPRHASLLKAKAGAASDVAGRRGAGPRAIVLGRSVRGRRIRAWAVGAGRGRRRVLVVGCVHGDESAGLAVTRRLRRARARGGASVWIVDAFNPDGCAAGTRQNARGVDLNRNSPWRWRPLDRLGGPYYSGPRPLSEPESRAIVRSIGMLRPAITIWFHQHAAVVDASGGDIRVERGYARMVGLPLRRLGRFPGSITSWQNSVFRRDTAFVVELPAGPLTRTAVRRHVNAVLRLAAGR